MKLQQLRYLREIAKRGLNLSEAAEALHTSQPGVSKQIRLLEEELGVDILVRRGKRVSDMTEPGRMILTIVERILHDADDLKQVAREFSSQGSGSIVIATTHTQARYALPPVVSKFMQRYPKVRLSLRQGSPEQIAEFVRSGDADIAITTEAAHHYEGLTLLPCHQWNRCVITSLRHPLLHEKPLTLEAIARHPIITYDFAFTGDSPVKRAFDQKRLVPNVVLTAIDADVIKAYVERGLGVGILAKMAFDPARDMGLRLIDASHLFEPSMARIGLRPNAYLRGYVYEFIEMFAPHLKRAVVDATLKGEGSSYEL
ncbi:MAG: CysB family HTH-type transcriptional regulator [Betaproteobacteria bacterium]|nr:CysB family HTH-type transcriptional regulator [Betaproteobacteria bacterium]MDH3436562.1 CysB family HTH-type transcriptional regulator [Betaproteobacteria bacterium]